MVLRVLGDRMVGANGGNLVWSNMQQQGLEVNM